MAVTFCNDMVVPSIPLWMGLSDAALDHFFGYGQPSPNTIEELLISFGD